MEDINVLSKQILERAEKEGQSKLEEYQEKADQEIENKREELNIKEKQEKEAIELALNNEFERQIQTLKNKQRNQLLAKKQDLLNQVFEEAVIEIEQWDKNEFAKFLTSVLNPLDKNKEWILVPGERSIDLIKANHIKTILSDYSFVNVSDQVVKNKAGFILEQGGIDYNFTFDALIDELKKEFSPQLATLAFQNNE